MDYENGMYISNVKNKHIGFILDIRDSKIKVKDMTAADNKTWNIEDIQFLPPYILDGKTIKNIITFNQDLSQLGPEDNALLNCKSDGTYKINSKDLLEGIENILAENPLLYYFARWFCLMATLRDEIGIETVDQYESLDEKEIISYAFEQLQECSNLVFSEQKLDIDALDRIVEILEHFQKEKNLPLQERWICDDLLKRVISQWDFKTLDSASVQGQDLFVLCLERLCEKGYPKALQKKGYCLYTGCGKYPQNWSLCKDIFIQYYQLTGDASAANTLGYIFYYGRSNHGIPEYDKAFYYFSIGHAHGYFESTYKLGDLFAHGYGVVKNEETAFYLYSSLYDENYERFINGEKDHKFADVALRLGNCYKKGIGTSVDEYMAYVMYLQAEYAIRQRLKYNEYGDTNVAIGIQNALTDIQKNFNKPKKTVRMKQPDLMQFALDRHRKAKIKWKKLSDGSYSLDIVSLPYPKENQEVQMLVTVVEAAYCQLRKDIRFYLPAGAELKVKENKNEFVFDSYEYDEEMGRCDLFFNEELVGIIVSDAYIFKAPVLSKNKKGNKIRFVQIFFKPGGRKYDYICDFDVNIGDIVFVAGYDGESEAFVVGIYEKYESECILPIERYRKIIRKK